MKNLTESEVIIQKSDRISEIRKLVAELNEEAKLIRAELMAHMNKKNVKALIAGPYILTITDVHSVTTNWDKIEAFLGEDKFKEFQEPNDYQTFKVGKA